MESIDFDGKYNIQAILSDEGSAKVGFNAKAVKTPKPMLIKKPTNLSTALDLYTNATKPGKPLNTQPTTRIGASRASNFMNYTRENTGDCPSKPFRLSTFERLDT